MVKDEESENTMPPAQKSSWFSFLKSLSSVSDLSSLTAPSFILAPISLAEFPAYWAEHPEQIASIEQGNTPEERMVRVTQFFISTFNGSYTSRGTKTGSEKKPLNPVLGEVFTGQWSKYHQWLVAEQVSHHPPKTAYHLENGAFALDGFSGQKTSFNGRHIIVKQSGHAMVTLKLQSGEERYLITLPTLKIDGLWVGSPFTELVGTCQISSSTGLTSTIDLKGKGFFSGKVHQFKLTISKTSSSDTIAEVEGQWSGKSSYTSSSALHKGQLFWDAAANPSLEIEIKPVDQQEELESRRLWKDVAEGIRTGNFDLASKAKNKIETDQRAQRKERQASGKEYPLQYFTHVASDSNYKELGSQIKVEPSEEEGYPWNGKVPRY